MKKYLIVVLITFLFLYLCVSCATSKKEAQKVIVENVDIKGIWVNLTSDDKEFINAISGNNNFEDIGIWFKENGRAQIVFKTNGKYFSSEKASSTLKYKISGAGLSLKFPDESIIKGIVKISNNQMILTIPDTPPLVITMTKYEGKEPAIVK
ncbi:MAG: hypothetical protein GX297_04615 [Treponema sp.]|jgi:hypothetical protein|nr:hypothetical protein [Treponema sp.]